MKNADACERRFQLVSLTGLFDSSLTDATDEEVVLCSSRSQGHFWLYVLR